MIDTHAHLHFADAFSDIDACLERAHVAGIRAAINVGVSPEDSRAAIAFALRSAPIKLYATAGVHPHEAGRGVGAVEELHAFSSDVVAIGECGLDYYKNHASKSEQDHVLRAQVELALEADLPLVFHVRDAWDDFFAVLKDYPVLRGVIHSFTGHQREVERALEHKGELYFGLNGIMTFTKDEAQLAAARMIPVERIVLETDCPYLAPVPHRGKRNEPAYVPAIVDFLSLLRGEELDQFTKVTTDNAQRLFGIAV